MARHNIRGGILLRQRTEGMRVCVRVPEVGHGAPLGLVGVVGQHEGRPQQATQSALELGGEEKGRVERRKEKVYECGRSDGGKG